MSLLCCSRGGEALSRPAKSVVFTSTASSAGAASETSSKQVEVDELPADSPEAAAELLMDLKRVVIAPGKFAQEQGRLVGTQDTCCTGDTCGNLRLP